MTERTVDAYVATLPPRQREIAQAVREVVREAAPEAKESIKWAQPVYEAGGPFAYFKAHREHVTFGFWRGVEVDDGRGILETSGSKMAHVRLRTVADVDRELLAGLVKRAVALNRDKGDPSRTR